MSIFEQIFLDEHLDQVLVTEGSHEFTLADYVFLKFCGITVDDSLAPDLRDQARQVAVDTLVQLVAKSRR